MRFSTSISAASAYSHIVDPKTGLGLTTRTGVTVIAKDCITADSLATAVSVLGPQAGLKLIENTPGAAALIVRATAKEPEVFESPEFDKYVVKPPRAARCRASHDCKPDTPMNQFDASKNDRDRTDSTTRLAAERTLLAWIRTSLAMMGFGFVVARFGLFLRELVAHDRDLPIRSYGVSLWIGTTLVLLGVATSLIAAGQHFRVLRHLARRAHRIPAVAAIDWRGDRSQLDRRADGRLSGGGRSIVEPVNCSRRDALAKSPILTKGHAIAI